MTSQDTLVLHLVRQRGLVEDRLVEEAIRLQQEKRPDVPIADLLVEMGWLAESDRATLLGELRDSTPTMAEPATIVTPSDRATPMTMTGSRSGINSTVRYQKGQKAGALEGYEILEEVAHGGMGIVYKARQIDLDRVVALKVMIAGEHATEEMLERFHREAKAAAKLQHPNIVQIYDVGRDGAKHYFTMRYVDGLPISKLVEKKEVTPRRALELTRKIALALDYAHSQGVIHRDVKPSNILVDRQGEPHLADFGLAKDVASGDMTAPGSRLGTPNYAPPEQCEGNLEKVDARSDVYSLGATLYEMLAGKPPFAGESMVNILVQVLLHDPEPPRKVNPNIHRDIETICLKAMQKEPAKRYASAGEMARDVERFLNGEPIQARPATTWDRARAWARKNRAAAVGLAALVVMAAAGIWVYASVSKARSLDREKLAREQREGGRVRDELARKEAAERKRSEARLHLDEGRSKTGAAAEAEFGKAMAADPDWSEPYLERGKLRINSNQNDGAVEDLSNAIAKGLASGEKPVLAYYLRGRVLDARMHQGRQAAADYQAAVKLEPESDLAYLALGASHIRNLDMSKALRCFRDAIEANPKNPDAFYWRARSAFQGEAWQRVLDDTQAALKLAPGHLGAYALNLAAQYAMANPPPTQTADQVVGLPLNDPELLLILARAFAAKKDAQRAKVLVDRAVQMDPKNPYCHQQKGYVLVSLDAPAEEIKAAFEEAVKCGPDDPVQYLLRGLLYLDRFKDAERAKADFEQAAKVDPDFPTNWLVRALLAERENRLYDALTMAQKALELGPDPGFAVLAGRTKGWCNIHLVELDDALQTFQETIRQKEALEPWIQRVYSALKVVPSDSQLYLDLGQLYVARGEYDKALAALDKAIADDPHSYESVWLVGLIHMLCGRYRKADEVYQEAMKITPMNDTERKQVQAFEPQLRRVLATATTDKQVAPVFEMMVGALALFRANNENQGPRSEQLDLVLRSMYDFQWLLWEKAGNDAKLVSSAKSILRVTPWDPSACVRLAVGYARCGDAANCAQALADAEKLGFRNWAYVQSSPDFEKVRSDPAFPRH